MSDRLTRKEIKRDEVMEGLSRVAFFIADNTKALGLGLAAVLALVAGYAVWQAVGESREEAANEALSAAISEVSDSGTELVAARDSLTVVADQYGSTRAGSIAYAYLGTIAAQEGDLDTARGHWQAFLGRHDDDALAAAIERNLIALDRSEGKSSELAERLRAALANGSSALGEDSVLYELGRTLEELGQVDGAREIYTRLLDEHPASVHASSARERSAALEAS